MPSSIKYKKIYIDTKYRSSDSTQHPILKNELPETMSFEEDAVYI